MWLDVTLARLEWFEAPDKARPVLDIVLRSSSGRGRERVVRLSVPSSLDDIVSRVENGVDRNEHFFEYEDHECRIVWVARSVPGACSMCHDHPEVFQNYPDQFVTCPVCSRTAGAIVSVTVLADWIERLLSPKDGKTLDDRVREVAMDMIRAKKKLVERGVPDEG